MALTAIEVKRLTCPTDKKQIKKSDGNGLFLLIKSTGSKLWRFRFRFNNKHQELALGQYPAIPLVEARQLAIDARKLLTDGINPCVARRKRKQPEASTLFLSVATAWWEQQNVIWSDGYTQKVKRWIDVDLKALGEMSVEEIETGDIVDLILTIKSVRKAPPILSVISRVFNYAIAHRMTRHNPAQGILLSDVLGPLPKIKSRAAITSIDELGTLVNHIDEDDGGSYCTNQALTLIPRIFLRPKEVRYLKWEYIDFEKSLIAIPAEVMKMSREHLVPMSSQVVTQLLAVKEMTSYSEFVFPNERNAKLPLSKNVMTNRLRKLGYPADVMSVHGFRATASSILHENHWSHDAIEAQLAHAVGSETSRAYNRSIHLAERKKMMQWWSDYLEDIS